MKNTKNILRFFFSALALAGIYILLDAFLPLTAYHLPHGLPLMAFSPLLLPINVRNIMLPGVKGRPGRYRNSGGDYDNIRDIAHRRLSSFGGDRGGRYENAGGRYNDPMLSFGGAGSFRDMLMSQSQKAFVITIVNTDAVNTYNINFTPGITGVIAPNPTGTSLQITDGVIPGTGGLVTASAQWTPAGTTGGIQALLNYHKQNPVQLQGLKINSNSPAQITVTATYTPQDPYHSQLAAQEIVFGTQTDENDFKPSFITLNLMPWNITWGNQEIFTIPIVPSSNTQFMLFFGANANTTHYLQSKAQQGVQAAASSGTPMNSLGGNKMRR